MSKIDERFEKMQDSINILRNQLDVLKQSSMEEEGIYEIFPATILYHKSTSEKRFIDFNTLEFPVAKYFIDEIQHRSNKLKHQMNETLEVDISNLITTTFGSEDYVMIISNESDYNSNTLIKQSFKSLVKNKVGKITINKRESELDNEYNLHSLNKISKTHIEASVKRSYLNVLNYSGHSIENENVILLNDEFGCNDALTSLLIELKPKKLLNILFTGRNSWFSNVD